MSAESLPASDGSAMKTLFERLNDMQAQLDRMENDLQTVKRDLAEAGNRLHEGQMTIK